MFWHDASYSKEASTGPISVGKIFNLLFLFPAHWLGRPVRQIRAAVKRGSVGGQPPLRWCDSTERALNDEHMGLCRNSLAVDPYLRPFSAPNSGAPANDGRPPSPDLPNLSERAEPCRTSANCEDALGRVPSVRFNRLVWLGKMLRGRFERNKLRDLSDRQLIDAGIDLSHAGRGRAAAVIDPITITVLESLR